MAQQIDKVRASLYKQERLKGRDKAAAMIKAGFAETTAYHKQHTGLVKVVDNEIMQEFKACEVTVESVLREIELGMSLAQVKGDIATYMRGAELKGKYLAMFTDKSEVTNKNPEKIIISYTTGSIPSKRISNELQSDISQLVDTKADTLTSST